MSIGKIQTGFREYLEKLSIKTGKEYVDTDNDVSIFKYAKEFKNYLKSELNADLSILSASISEILNMEVVDGKLVLPDETDESIDLSDSESLKDALGLNESDETAATEGDDETSEVDASSETDVDESDETAATEGDDETSEVDEQTGIKKDETDESNSDAEPDDTAEEDLSINKKTIVDFLNAFLEMDIVKNIVDADASGELDGDEIMEFLNSIKNGDGDDSNISFDDLIASYESIANPEGEDSENNTSPVDNSDKKQDSPQVEENSGSNKEEPVQNKEIQVDNTPETTASQPVQANNPATNNSGGSNPVSRSGGVNNSSNNNQEQEKTLDNMSAAELNKELTDAKLNRDNDKTALEKASNGTSDALKNLKELENNAYQNYIDEIAKEDSELAENMSTLKKAIDKKQNDINLKEAEITCKEQEISSLELDLKNAEFQISAYDAQISELENTSTENMTSKQKGQLASKITNLNAEKDKAQAKIDKLVNDKIPNAKSELEQLKKEKDDLINNEETGLNALNAQMQEYEAQASALEESNPKIAELKTQYETAKSNFETAQKDAISEATQTLQKSQAYVDEVQAALIKAETNDVKTENSIIPYNKAKGDALVQATQNYVKGNSKPGGYCAKGVAAAINKAFGYQMYGNAWTYQESLANRSDWYDATSEYDFNTLKTVPAGAVVVWSKYQGGQYGHIFISDGKGNEYSDFTKPINVDYYKNRGATFKVFYPI